MLWNSIVYRPKPCLVLFSHLTFFQRFPYEFCLNKCQELFPIGKFGFIISALTNNSMDCLFMHTNQTALRGFLTVDTTVTDLHCKS